MTRFKMNVRPLFILMHRHVGLSIAVFLLVAGLTGSLLAFFHELDALVNPSLYNVATDQSAEPMDIFALRKTVDDQVDGMTFNSVSMKTEPSEAVVFYGTPDSTPEPGQEMDSQYFVDPNTGQILGSRLYGDIRQGTKNLMPFIYRLHYQLNLGQTGSLLFGIAALLWTIDCFVGAYLTFPPRGSRKQSGTEETNRKSRLVRWFPAWLVRTGILFKLTFTWHRASGLWVCC